MSIASYGRPHVWIAKAGRDDARNLIHMYVAVDDTCRRDVGRYTLDARIRVAITIARMWSMYTDISAYLQPMYHYRSPSIKMTCYLPPVRAKQALQGNAWLGGWRDIPSAARGRGLAVSQPCSSGRLPSFLSSPLHSFQLLRQLHHHHTTSQILCGRLFTRSQARTSVTSS